MEIIKAIAIFAMIAAVGISIGWFAFSPQSDRYEANLVRLPRVGASGGQLYDNLDFGFEIVVPRDWSIDDTYAYRMLSTGREIPGVSFRPSQQASTQLSVEESSDTVCAPDAFIQNGSPTGYADFVGETYSVSSTTDSAGMVETVYVRQVGHRCFAVRTESAGQATRGIVDLMIGSLVIY